MAATRYEASPSRPIQGGRQVTTCPTCGRTRLLDGHLGALQRPGSCTQRCYAAYRQFNLAREFIGAGVSVSYSVGIAPPVFGGGA